MKFTVLAFLFSVLGFEMPAFAAGESVWFAPNLASQDYVNLFTQPEAWSSARSQIQVFKFYQGNASNENDPALGGNDYPALKNAGAFSKLRQWGIKTAIEVGALKPWANGCSGAATAEIIKQTILKVEAAGGQVDYLSIDEGMHGGQVYCKYDMNRSAQEVIVYMRALKAFRPQIKIGLIEPFPVFNAQQLAQWISTLANAGVAPDHFHIDVDRNSANIQRIDVAGNLRNLQAHTQALGISFGVILWSGYDPLPSDQAYYTKTMEFATELRQGFQVLPGTLIVQSWVHRGSETTPSLPVNLPDSNPGVFSLTRLVRDALALFGQGTALPKPQGPGFYRIDGQPAVYNSNGAGAFCAFNSWEDYMAAGGQANMSNVKVVSSFGAGLRNDGLCQVPMKQGFFKFADQAGIFNSNGVNAYCHFNSWPEFIRAGGQANLSNVRVVTAFSAAMHDDGACVVP